MNKSTRALFILCLTLSVPAVASAHASPEHGLVAGLIHPLTGLDHWVILLAAGFWAQRMGGTARAVAVMLGVLQGYVHAADGPLDAGLEWFVGGVVLTSAMLMGIGMLWQRTFERRLAAIRIDSNFIRTSANRQTSTLRAFSSRQNNRYEGEKHEPDSLGTLFRDR
jgi:hydrogenase/urease accessory protein HupE